MNEIFPVLYGVCVGFVCSVIAARRRRYLCCVGLSVLFGVAATLLTGERKFGWEFLLIDIPLVAASSLVVMALRNWGWSDGQPRALRWVCRAAGS